MNGRGSGILALLLSWGIIFGASAYGQVVFGTLTNSATGLPVQGTVRMSPAGFGGGGSTETTNADGSYMANVAAGPYRVAASCVGCSTQIYGQKTPASAGRFIHLKAGDRIRIDFRMLPTSVITGRVVDEDGDPLSQVVVETYSYRFGVLGDRGELLPGVKATTNDRGEYRLFGLGGGEYFVGIRDRLGYPALFFPDTTEPSAARPIPLNPGGEVANIDFHRRRLPGITIRGRVRPAGQGVRTEVSIVRGGRIAVPLSNPLGRGFARADGTYEIGNIPPGEYHVTAISSEGWGATPVKAGPTDLADVDIVLQRGFALRGHVSQRPGANASVVLQQMTLQLEEMSGLGGSAQATVGNDGAVTFTSLRPGTYRLVIYGYQPGHIETARLGTQDALRTFTVGDGSDPLEIIIGFASGRVAATVRDAAGLPYAGGFVALVADEPRRGRVDSTYTAVTDSSGQALMTNVAPGTYRLLAWEEQPPVYAGSLFDREYLKRFEERGVPVRVEANGLAEGQTLIIPTP